MTKGYEKLLENIQTINPPQDLQGRIIKRISILERRRLRIWLVLFGSLSIVSCGLIVFAFKYTMQEFVRSGFYQYLSLLLSDGGTIITYWKEFTILLAESLPVFGIALLLSSVFIFVLLLRFASKNIKTALLPI